jgi:hypothetical protein
MDSVSQKEKDPSFGPITETSSISGSALGAGFKTSVSVVGVSSEAKQPPGKLVA